MASTESNREETMRNSKRRRLNPPPEKKMALSKDHEIDFDLLKDKVHIMILMILIMTLDFLKYVFVVLYC